jgi:hypothetical protein
VTWLSRLLTPLMLTCGELAAAAAVTAGARGAASVAEKWPAGSRRAPLGSARIPAAGFAACTVLGTSRVNPGVPV